jgi:hypothetical protein
MTRTRSFQETLQARARRGQAFRDAPPSGAADAGKAIFARLHQCDSRNSRLPWFDDLERDYFIMTHIRHS